MVGKELLDESFIKKLEKLRIMVRRSLRGRRAGERRTKEKGRGLEFADFRNYVFGDDPRFIDWNTYARLERLFIKLFMEEKELTVYLFLDVSKSMQFGEPNKLTGECRIAAALGYITLANNDRLIVADFAQQLNRWLGPISGRNQTKRLFDFLTTTESDHETNLAQSCKQFLSRYQRPGLFILISDFLCPDGYESAVKLIQGAGNETLVIQVLSPQEVEPELTGELELEDSELSSLTEISMSPRLIKAYKQRLDSYCQGLKTYCLSRGIAYILFVSADSVENLILRYLRTLGILK